MSSQYNLEQTALKGQWIVNLSFLTAPFFILLWSFYKIPISHCFVIA